MTTYTNKQEAQNESNKINKTTGFNISFVTFIGESLTSIYGVDKKGWYVCNNENKKYY